MLFGIGSSDVRQLLERFVFWVFVCCVQSKSVEEENNVFFLELVRSFVEAIKGRGEGRIVVTSFGEFIPIREYTLKIPDREPK